jgi:hypothetical protein
MGDPIDPPAQSPVEGLGMCGSALAIAVPKATVIAAMVLISATRIGFMGGGE